jgi:glutamate/aspartate transport system substrate-binding protein
MRRVWIGLAAILAVCAGAQAQGLQGTLKKISDTKSISLGHRDSSIPFSYLDDQQRVIGYSLDLCARIIEAVKAELKINDLAVSLVPVTSATRIPLLANGSVDLDCGSNTNTVERQRQVAFSVTTYITASRFVSKKAANIRAFDDLKGKTVVSTAGATNLRQITEANAQRKLGMNIISAKDHAEGFLLVETDRAAAFVMDDILLYGLVANAKSPADYVVSAEALSVEPYALMVRRDDPPFKQLVDGALTGLFRSGEISAIYKKWYESPIPPRGINLQLPMSAALKRAIANPTDSADPATYQD